MNQSVGTPGYRGNISYHMQPRLCVPQRACTLHSLPACGIEQQFCLHLATTSPPRTWIDRSMVGWTIDHSISFFGKDDSSSSLFIAYMYTAVDKQSRFGNEDTKRHTSTAAVYTYMCINFCVVLDIFIPGQQCTVAAAPLRLSGSTGQLGARFERHTAHPWVVYARQVLGCWCLLQTSSLKNISASMSLRSFSIFRTTGKTPTYTLLLYVLLAVPGTWY